MTTNDVLTRVASILTTLNEEGIDGSPESVLYLACNADIHLWEVVRDVLVKSGYITTHAHYVRLTDAGRAKAVEIEQALAEKK